ncbi:MAG: hypothetical protein WC523_07670 [Patescibacteria group bacterium]|jgi:hypothetical protein
MAKINPDKQWQLFNKELEETMKLGDLYTLGAIYYEMTEFLVGEGKDGGQLRGLGYQMKLRLKKKDLKEYEAYKLLWVEIVCDDASCKKCKKMDGKVISLEEAKNTNPLPIKECARLGGCRCVYAPVIK